MAHRDACAKGHRYIAGSYSWRPNGTRRCLVCEKLGREARKAKQQPAAEPPSGWATLAEDFLNDVRVAIEELKGQEPAR